MDDFFVNNCNQQLCWSQVLGGVGCLLVSLPLPSKMEQLQYYVPEHMDSLPRLKARYRVGISNTERCVLWKVCSHTHLLLHQYFIPSLFYSPLHSYYSPLIICSTTTRLYDDNPITHSIQYISTLSVFIN